MNKKNKIDGAEQSALSKTTTKKTEIAQPSIDTLKSERALSAETIALYKSDVYNESETESKSITSKINQSSNEKIQEGMTSKDSKPRLTIHSSKNSKRFIGQKNEVFQFFDNLYTGYFVILFLILIGMAVWFIFSTFPLLEAILIVGAGFLLICALVALGSLVNNGLNFF